MTDNRPVFYPSFGYRDAPAAIAFLCAAFGFERLAVYEGEGGTIQHAELSYGPGVIMLGSAKDGDGNVGRQQVYVAVDDPDAHHARARAAGAEIFMDLRDTDYGSRDYGARDPEGNVWYFGTYRPGA